MSKFRMTLPVIINRVISRELFDLIEIKPLELLFSPFYLAFSINQSKKLIFIVCAQMLKQSRKEQHHQIEAKRRNKTRAIFEELKFLIRSPKPDQLSLLQVHFRVMLRFRSFCLLFLLRFHSSFSCLVFIFLAFPVLDGSYCSWWQR